MKKLDGSRCGVGWPPKHRDIPSNSGFTDVQSWLQGALSKRRPRGSIALRLNEPLLVQVAALYLATMLSPDSNSIRWLRLQFIAAIASDPVLLNLLVLKGGNALNLAHEVGARSSLDLDYSLAESSPDLEELSTRLFASIRDRLIGHGWTLFDQEFRTKPRSAGELAAGYLAEFKLVRSDIAGHFADDIDQLRRLAQTVDSDGRSGRKFRIEISRHEYCDAKESIVIDGVACWVYTIPLIVAEKLRALCQQMDGGGRSRVTARARDFYDIWAAWSASGLDLARAENTALLKAAFHAKGVPLSLLENLAEQRDFHRVDWPSVEAAVAGSGLRDFDYYFDFVVREVDRLKALGVIDPPGRV